eukprot:6491328-Amphidinium_carterae.2
METLHKTLKLDSMKRQVALKRGQGDTARAAPLKQDLGVLEAAMEELKMLLMQHEEVMCATRRVLVSSSTRCVVDCGSTPSE